MAEIKQKPRFLAAKTEEDKIARKVLVWINTFTELPADLDGDMVKYERLSDKPSMALSTIPGTYITRQYIYGGHEAEYRFKLIYRVTQLGASDDKRLKADELLNRFGDWAREHWPDLGEGITVRRVEPMERAELFGQYANGDEDHQIIMRLIYEVI